MTGFAQLAEYAAEVLGFDFAARPQAGAAGPSALPPPPDAAALARLRDRVLAAYARSGQSQLTLLGVGSGALAGALARSLPPGALCVAELDAGLARAAIGSALFPCGRESGAGPALCGLATDSSVWAVFALLEAAHFGPGQALVLPNPELGPEAKRTYRVLELLLTRSVAVAPPVTAFVASPAATRFPRLSVAAILAPTEPDLQEFFAQFPPWLAELVLVWDAQTVPEAALSAAALPEFPFPVRHIARPLGADFSAQRNAMLAACTGDWVLYLDADERFSPACWEALPNLCAVESRGGLIGGWHFPRLTPYPNPAKVLVGFGLWPDIQLRLFRNAPGLRFENPVHERLTGLAGAQGLALGLEIEHLNRLRKSAEDIRIKFAGFDAAGGGRVHHALSAEYPSVARGLVSQSPERGRLFLLPPHFA